MQAGPFRAEPSSPGSFGAAPVRSSGDLENLLTFSRIGFWRPVLSDPVSSIRGMNSAVIGLTDEALLAAWTELEQRRRRSRPQEHALIAEIESRGLARERGMRSTAVLGAGCCGSTRARRGLGWLRRRIWVRGAGCPANRWTRSTRGRRGAGRGRDFAQHAKVVIDTVEALPDAVRAEHEDQVEADLVGYARQFDPQSWPAPPGASPRCSIPTARSRMSSTGTGAATSTCTAAPTVPPGSRANSTWKRPNTCWWP